MGICTVKTSYVMTTKSGYKSKQLRRCNYLTFFKSLGYRSFLDRNALHSWNITKIIAHISISVLVTSAMTQMGVRVPIHVHVYMKKKLRQEMLQSSKEDRAA